MLDRRIFLQGSSAGVLASAFGPGLAFAKAPTDKIFIMIILRGGLDGLSTLVPYSDKDYLNRRPRLAIKNPLKLGGYFGLHPELRGLHNLYQNNELVLIPAISTAYRLRSHFDGQNFLENGAGRPFGASDGWLNRALSGLEGGGQLGLSVGPQIPLILQGGERVRTWAESDLPELSEGFMASLSKIYAEDPIFARALQDAQGAPDPMLPNMGRRRRNTNLLRNANAAARIMATKDGPRIAVIDSLGWDTHKNQNSRLSGLLRQVDESVSALKIALRDYWKDTVIMVVSEFGRTVSENANQGTDHGTGGLCLMAGGAVKGGRVAGDWPGLGKRSLYENRDLRAVNSLESVFKSVLISHLGVTDSHVADHVFPGNKTVPMGGLL